MIFPPRWLVAEDTFRPPWYHRNVMSEFMGLVYGQYDAKPEGFQPGGASPAQLHGAARPRRRSLREGEQRAELAPHKLDDTLAFMFESRWRFVPTEFAMNGGALDAGYARMLARLEGPIPEGRSMSTTTLTTLDATHDPTLRSWVASANAAGSDFPIQNLPFGRSAAPAATSRGASASRSATRCSTCGSPCAVPVGR